MAQDKFTKVTTPKGEAMWANIKNPETYQGNVVGLTIQVKFDQESTTKFINLIQAEFEKAKSSPYFKGKQWSKDPALSYREDKDGNILFKFKTKHEYKRADGEIVKRTVPVFDAKGVPFKSDDEIGNGSVVKVACQIVPYHISSKNNGVTLYLDGVQILDFKPRNTGASASALGFGVEEGFDCIKSEAEKIFGSDSPDLDDAVPTQNGDRNF